MVEDLRNQKLTEISNWRDVQENANIIFELDNRQWDGGKASQERLAPVVMAGSAGKLPEGFFWTDAENYDVPVNFAFLLQLEVAMMQAMVMHGFRIQERQRHMKSEVALLTDVNAIAEYPVGWRESK